MATDINTTKTRLHRLLQSVEHKPTEASKTPSSVIPTLLTICLLGTMLPLQFAVAFFSLSTVTLAGLSLILSLKKQLTFTAATKGLLAALTVTSVLSGCSPAFTFQNQPELIKFAHENQLEFHTIQRVGILGLGLNDATIATAQAESNIKELRGAQVDNGHGLINVVQITIAGKL